MLSIVSQSQKMDQVLEQLKFRRVPMSNSHDNMSHLVGTFDCINLLSRLSLLLLHSSLVHMSMLSLNLKTPFDFKTPSMPSGSRRMGSLKNPLSIRGSADLSVTSTSPCALIDSINAGIIS